MACRCSSCSQGFVELTQPTVAFLNGEHGRLLSSMPVSTPEELAREYAAMLTWAHPQRRPRLMCRDHVAQVGRWFAQGVLVLGLEDIRQRAQLLRRMLQVRQQHGTWLRPVPHPAELNRFARRQVLAHELGHELNRHDRRASPFDEHPEAAADFWAGWLEAQRLGGDEALGAAFFALIGCNQAGCSHPTSSKRAEAYQAGFAAGRRVEAPASKPRVTSRDRAPQAAASPPRNSGPSAEDILAGVGLGAAAVVGMVGVAKLLEALFDGGKSYDANVGRYRDKRGRFT